MHKYREAIPKTDIQTLLYGSADADTVAR